MISPLDKDAIPTMQMPKSHPYLLRFVAQESIESQNNVPWQTSASYVLLR